MLPLSIWRGGYAAKAFGKGSTVKGHWGRVESIEEAYGVAKTFNVSFIDSVDGTTEPFLASHFIEWSPNEPVTFKKPPFCSKYLLQLYGKVEETESAQENQEPNIRRSVRKIKTMTRTEPFEEDDLAPAVKRSKYNSHEGKAN